MSFQKSRLFQIYVFSKNSVFFQKFRTFQKIPRSKKVDFFNKSSFDTKSRFLTPNTIHRHKHLFFPKAFLIYLLFFTHLTSKTCQKHVFNRTISMFDINYRDQKLLCITNLIPVGRPRTNFRTFLKRSEY